MSRIEQIVDQPSQMPGYWIQGISQKDLCALLRQIVPVTTRMTACYNDASFNEILICLGLTSAGVGGH